MKLKVTKQAKNMHTNIVGNITWAPNNQIYSVSDDKTILSWDINGNYIGKFLDLDTFYTAADWNNSTKGGELLALGSADGQLKLVGRNGKIEKVVTNAHTMAITCVQWSIDGNTIVTSGEDGHIKTWSRQAELRNHFVKDSTPIYSVKWNHDATVIIYCSGNSIFVEPVLKGGLKTLKWKAHDELILCLDWSQANKLILSGGEDKKYKVWDQYGRNLYTSSPFNTVITSISWAPSGEYFAVGSFENIRLCNKTGWSYSFSKVQTGGVLSLGWNSEGTTLAAAGVSI